MGGIDRRRCASRVHAFDGADDLAESSGILTLHPSAPADIPTPGERSQFQHGRRG